MSEIDVRLGVDYKSKNLLRAQKDLRGLGAAAEFAKLKMAGAAYAIYRLGKESVIAAAKAQKLDTTFATSLRNMNIGNQTQELLTYIDKVSLATGVLDSELIPAFSRLLSSTKNVAASQKLLNIAVDTAQGTGKDLSTVTTILTKAMEGQRKGLSSLGLGIDAATLKTMDLAEVVAALEKAYGGTAAANANTFAGILDRVRRSAELAKESMGQAFLSQLDLSAQEMADLNTAVQAAAKGFGWLMGAVGSFVATSISGLRNVRDYFMQDPIIRWIVEKMGLGGTSIYTGNPNLRGLYKKTPEERANEALMKLLKKMDEDAKKRDAAELARQRAAEAARKRQAALDKELAQKQMRYDTERIGLQAAFARSEDDVTKARIRDLLALNTAQYASALGLNTILDIEKLVQEQLDKIVGTQMKWNTEIYKSIAGYGQLESAAASSSYSSTIQKAADSTMTMAQAMKTLEVTGLGLQGVLGGLARLQEQVADRLKQQQLAAQAATVATAMSSNPTIAAYLAGQGPTDESSQFAAMRAMVMRASLAAGGLSSNQFWDAVRQAEFESALSSGGYQPLTPDRAAQIVVNVQAAGSIIAQQDLQQVVTDAVNQAARSGASLAPVGSRL